MKKRLNKNICLILLTVILLLQSFTLSSCNRSYDETEVITVTKVLLKDAEKLNLIYFGEGIRYYEKEGDLSNYRIAEKAHLDELGFHTIDELKSLTEKTFSQSYSNYIYSTILAPLTSDGKLVSATRYSEIEGEFVVRSTYIPIMKDTITYDYDSIKVKGADKEKVSVTVNATVTTKEGLSQNIDIVIDLVEEENGWRIDNPTYANYSDKRN